jgi:hypothetical protein
MRLDMEKALHPLKVLARTSIDEAVKETLWIREPVACPKMLLIVIKSFESLERAASRRWARERLGCISGDVYLIMPVEFRHSLESCRISVA